MGGKKMTSHLFSLWLELILSLISVNTKKIRMYFRYFTTMPWRRVSSTIQPLVTLQIFLILQLSQMILYQFRTLTYLGLQMDNLVSINQKYHPTKNQYLPMIINTETIRWMISKVL